MMVLTKKDIEDLFNKEQGQYKKDVSEAKSLDKAKAAHKDSDTQDKELDKDDLFIHTMKQMKNDVSDPDISNDSEVFDEDKENIDRASK
ncbi:hypothetical protein [Acetilactobacillus jinshanensis]|uniref:Uncharacterized protein n=1 Tax=Acetilactobacillus jinshanensis TaxID=1720083 RepID=A0A4P6ZKV7_9LACO|nr:hypothetical protein [Acetilactobacillus jinshanensis]QBP18396.1 hypothetical protein ELX58_04435 [Acetilactobacillus jinshanensis]URL61266.1 hypothetical protein HGK75_04530 [uncultured bacterium]